MGASDDLDIGMLDGDIQTDDFSIDLDSAQMGVKPKVDDAEEDIEKIKNNKISEEETLESVAEEGVGKTSGSSKTSPPSSNDKLPEIISSLATHFHEAGVLPSLNLEEMDFKSVDDFGEAIQKEIEAGRSANQIAYEEAMKNGEPKDSYASYVQNKERYEAITPEVLESKDYAELRFNIIAQDFLNRGFDRDESAKFAKRSQDLGEDSIDAAKSLERIKDHNETSYRTKIAEKDAKDQENVSNIQKFIESTDEIIKGIKLTQGTKDNLFKQMTTAVSRDEKGNPITEYGQSLTNDPVKTKAITEYLFYVTKGFKDFSKITSLIESKTTSNIDTLLKNAGSGFLSGNPIKDNESKFSIEDGLQIDV